MTLRARRAPGRRWTACASLALLLEFASAHAACTQLATLGTARGGDVDDASAGDASTRSDAGLEAFTIERCGTGNQADVDANTVEALRAGGAIPSGARLLYPYDGTVLPAGIEPPVFMWERASATAVRLTARNRGASYEGCLSPTAEGKLAMPQEAWEALMAAGEGADDPVEVTLTTWDGADAVGPLRLSLTLSPTRDLVRRHRCRRGRARSLPSAILRARSGARGGQSARGGHAPLRARAVREKHAGCVFLQG